jgi:hypothetical protein
MSRLAKRSNFKPLIGLYALSGKGKTASALLLARGFVGKEGKIGMIETESGRGEALAGAVIDGQEIGDYFIESLAYEEVDGKAIRDFSPESYGKKISIFEGEKVDALIIDSASHEWEGLGGVLDMADHNKSSKEKSGVLVWQKPKMDHQKHFMGRITQSPIPLVIICMRAKYPMKEIFNPSKGKKDWVRLDYPEPKQSEDILFEMGFHAWIDDEHKIRDPKYTVPSLQDVFLPGEVITLETGKRLAVWAAGGTPHEKPQVIKHEEVVKHEANARHIEIMMDRIAGCDDIATLKLKKSDWDVHMLPVQAIDDAYNVRLSILSHSAVPTQQANPEAATTVDATQPQPDATTGVLDAVDSDRIIGEIRGLLSLAMYDKHAPRIQMQIDEVADPIVKQRLIDYLAKRLEHLSENA